MILVVAHTTVVNIVLHPHIYPTTIPTHISNKCYLHMGFSRAPLDNKSLDMGTWLVMIATSKGVSKSSFTLKISNKLMYILDES